MLDFFSAREISHTHVDHAMSEVDSVMVCDAKNLYDAVYNRVESSGLHLEEKRTAIEVLSIRERTCAAGVRLRWVDSDQQFADGLSKVGAHDQLLSMCQKGCLRLVFDESFTSAKKKRAGFAKKGIS